MRAGELWSLGDYAAAGDRWAEASLRIASEYASPGARVLDIACGPGALAIAAAEAGAEATALDAAPALLDLARERAAAAGVTVHWVEADMTAIPAADDSFDLVASAFGCMFAPDPEAMAAELIRVCRPGGKVAVLAWTPESAFGAMAPLVGGYLPEGGGGAPVERWARPESVGEVFEDLPVDLVPRVRTVDVQWESLDQAIGEITGRNPAWIAIRSAVEPSGRWPELVDDLRGLLASHGGEASAGFTLPVDYLETVATRCP